MKKLAVVFLLFAFASPAMAGQRSLGPLSRWEVGQRGTCAYTPLIIQVIDGQHALLGTAREGALAIVKFPSTKGMVDGRTMSFGLEIIHVKDTVRYETIRGATKTVFYAVIED